MKKLGLILSSVSLLGLTACGAGSEASHSNSDTRVLPSLGFLFFKPSSEFTDEHTIVIGTTKLITFEFNFGGIIDPDAWYDTAVLVERTDSSSEADYEIQCHYGVSGTIQVTPMSLGKYSFSVSDGYGHTQKYAFTVVERLIPEKDMLGVEGNIALDFGNPIPVPFYFKNAKVNHHGTLERDDHYIQRYFDFSKIDITSSDESVFKIVGNYIVPVSTGSADILIDGKYASWAMVRPGKEIDNGPLSLSVDSTKVHYHDYDYYGYVEDEILGVQINANYDDVVYETSDELIGRVTIPHKEESKRDDSLNDIRGGFVQGYIKTGEFTVYAYRASDPTNCAQLRFKCEYATPESMDLAILGSWATVYPIDDISGTHKVGSFLEVKISYVFKPLNSYDQTLCFRSSDESVAIAREGRDYNSLRCDFLAVGETDITIYAKANPSLNIVVHMAVVEE